MTTFRTSAGLSELVKAVGTQVAIGLPADARDALARKLRDSPLAGEVAAEIVRSAPPTFWVELQSQVREGVRAASVDIARVVSAVQKIDARDRDRPRSSLFVVDAAQMDWLYAGLRDQLARLQGPGSVETLLRMIDDRPNPDLVNSVKADLQNKSPDKALERIRSLFGSQMIRPQPEPG